MPDLAIEMHVPVRACAVLWAESEYVAPQVGRKGTLVELNITKSSYSPDPASGGPTALYPDVPLEGGESGRMTTSSWR